MRKQLESLIPENTKANLLLKAFAVTKVPLIFATGAKITNVSDESCTVRMPFLKIIKNHLGSVYFGALTIGADVCVGFLAAYKINKSNKNISIVFKTFQAQFLKRAVGPTEFICDEGNKIDKLIEKVITTNERVHKKIKARAVTNGETVAEFTLELSLKMKQ